MKNTALLIILALVFSCATEKKEKKESQNETNTIQAEAAASEIEGSAVVEKKESAIVTDFLKNIESLEKEESNNPINAFREAADASAERVIALTKENMSEVLTEAKKYKYCVITTGDHTIVKIDDPENCKQSGSWGACMPYATGYIKKGELIFQEDYINFIIGRPDDQERTAYLFN